MPMSSALLCPPMASPLASGRTTPGIGAPIAVKAIPMLIPNPAANKMNVYKSLKKAVNCCEKLRQMISIQLVKAPILDNRKNIKRKSAISLPVLTDTL
jgi:hypothetical protein